MVNREDNGEETHTRNNSSDALFYPDKRKVESGGSVTYAWNISSGAKCK